MSSSSMHIVHVRCVVLLLVFFLSILAKVVTLYSCFCQPGRTRSQNVREFFTALCISVLINYMRDAATAYTGLQFYPWCPECGKLLDRFVTFCNVCRWSPSTIEMSTSSLFLVLMIGSAVAVVQEDATEEWGSHSPAGNCHCEQTKACPHLTQPSLSHFFALTCHAHGTYFYMRFTSRGTVWSCRSSRATVLSRGSSHEPCTAKNEQRRKVGGRVLVSRVWRLSCVAWSLTTAFHKGSISLLCLSI